MCDLKKKSQFSFMILQYGRTNKNSTHLCQTLDCIEAIF